MFWGWLFCRGFFSSPFKVVLMVSFFFPVAGRGLSLCWSTLTGYNTINFKSVKLSGVKPWMARSNCPAHRTMYLVSYDHMLQPLSSISVIYTKFCNYWKTKLKVVSEEEIKIEQQAT